MEGRSFEDYNAPLALKNGGCCCRFVCFMDLTFWTCFYPLSHALLPVQLSEAITQVRCPKSSRKSNPPCHASCTTPPCHAWRRPSRHAERWRTASHLCYAASRVTNGFDNSAARVRRLFAGIAGRYDFLNDVLSLGLHRRWKRRLVALADHAAGGADHPEGARDFPRVLDLCCGTGDLARRLSGRVIGVDFTIEMLQIAQKRCRLEPVHGNTAPRVGARRQFIGGDALQLPFADASFDVVSIGYGLRNVKDLAASLREICRVLRPGGWLLSLDFGKPANTLWRCLYFAHLRCWVPLLGWLLTGHRAAYAYILPSLKNYPGQRGVQAAMEQAGFVECGFEEFCGGAMAINYGRSHKAEVVGPPGAASIVRKVSHGGQPHSRI